MRTAWLFFKIFISSKYLSLLLRFYLGFLFMYASMSKISNPAGFAEVIASYQIIPYWSVNLFAVSLPWIEFVCGLFLIIGLRTQAVTLIVSLLLVAFTIGIFINLIRGVPIDCGCFSNVGRKISWWHIPRDLLYLIFAVQVFLYDRLYLLHRQGIICNRIEPNMYHFYHKTV